MLVPPGWLLDAGYGTWSTKACTFLINICPKIYIHRCQEDKAHTKIISINPLYFVLSFTRILIIWEKTSIRENCVPLNWWHSMHIFQKTLSNVYAFFEAREDYKNKLIWIAYLIGCNYVLSNLNFLNPLFFGNMVIVPFPM